MDINDFEVKLKEQYLLLSSHLNEKSKRLWAATEAQLYGYGGIIAVNRATRISKKTIHKGLSEIKNDKTLETKRIRKVGGGRKKITSHDNKLLQDLDRLIDPATRGDPESPLRWTSKSLRKLEEEMKTRGHKISYWAIRKILKEQKYSLQSNCKRHEGSNHIDRDEQFKHIHKKATLFLNKDQPVISVDTKKKELVGNFKNNGKEWEKIKSPIEVEAYDFPSKAKGKVAPYGVYDLGLNKGWVSVGISSDTAEFAVNSIRTWWLKMGKAAYNNVNEILITADCGGSNGYRVKLWKRELQKLTNELKVNIHVCHFPPGTSKWNKIEHRLFSYISKNWRGRPLVSLEM